MTEVFINALGGTRTRNQLIKSQLRYQLRYESVSVPDRIRTCDLLLRRQLLYPTALRGQAVQFSRLYSIRLPMLKERHEDFSKSQTTMFISVLFFGLLVALG